jgi:hypothetical protein
MAVNYARSTYDQILDSVLAELNEDSKLASLTPDEAIWWILKAQERICQMANIQEEYQLRYSSPNIDYPLQDRPPITAVTAIGTPISITSAGHGLAVNDNIFIRDVLGSEAANGRFRVSAVADQDNFTIKRFGRITAISDADDPVITSKDHPFLTGDSVTISEVQGATEVNGTFPATKIDKDRFSVDIGPVARNPYTGGGIVVADTSNTVAFAGGGRYWKEDEVPTHVAVLQDSTLEYSGVIHTVKVRTFYDLEREKTGIIDYNYLYPTRMALGNKNGRKYLRIDPKTSADGDLNLLFTIQVVPEHHMNDTGGMTILLPSEHNAAIEEYLKAKIYSSRLKDPKMAVFHMDEFARRVADFNIRQPRPDKNFVYH